MAEIHWQTATSGNFTLGNWGRPAPGPNDDALLDPAGANFTVTSGANEVVQSIQLAANATLDISAGTFAARIGTGGGANAGHIAVGSGATLSVGGSVDNTSSIELDGAFSMTTELHLAYGDTTLSGGGELTLAGPNDVVRATSKSDTLTNVDNTISGAGVLGQGGLNIVNESKGVIDATGAGKLLRVVSGLMTLRNSGLLEATGGATLYLATPVLDQSSGGTAVAGAGSRLELQGFDVIGGTVMSTGSGKVLCYNGGTFDGRTATVTLGGDIFANTGITLEGTINNTGTLSFSGADVFVGSSGASLTGGGTVNLLANKASVIAGATAASVLTNVGDRIIGSGLIGNGAMVLVNDTGGRIINNTTAALTIDTGANTVVNSGQIGSSGAGGVVIKSAVDNTGTLSAALGNLTVQGAVTGAGSVWINAARADFASSFSEAVSFGAKTSAVGVLELARSRSYAGTISGFSKTGGTALDLDDIAFGASTKASYAGTNASGVLSVTEGTHTAHIHLKGNYLASTFTVSSDGHGGTTVTDPAAGQPARLAAAIAALGPAPAAHRETWAPAVHAGLRQGVLARP